MTTDKNIIVQNCYIACACASRPNVMVWCSQTHMIIFSSKNNLCLADISQGSYYRIIQTIQAHADEITCVKLLKNMAANSNKYCTLFCTSSNNGEIALWGIEKIDGLYSICNIFRDQRQSSISLIKACSIVGEQLLFANSIFDKVEFKLCTEIPVGNVKNRLLPTLEFPGKIVTSFDFSNFKNLLLLAIGLSDGNIQFFHIITDEINTEIKHCVTIKNEHNVWVRAMSFRETTNGLWLAAASDNLIKIWEFSIAKEMRNDKQCDPMLTHHSFTVKDDKAKLNMLISIRLESVLNSDEGFLQSIEWHPDRLELLTSAINTNVMRWHYSNTESLWLPISRFGEITQDGSGYFDATYSPDGNSVAYHSLFGAVYICDIHEEKIYSKPHTIAGHSDSVTDIAWDPSGSYLLSCSFDKTTRIHTSLNEIDLFFEIARPQVHGHSLNCLSTISSTLYVSGAEEKIFRVFQASSHFAESLAQLAKIKIDFQNLSVRGFQSELTLTNVCMNSDNADPNLITDFFTDVPTEDQLNKFTLFPELKKLYGHGYEVFTVICNHAGTVFATACKASHPEQATIFLWDTNEFQQRIALNAHQLTVTQLAFSYNDKFLLSVSRDRTWTLFGLSDNNNYDFKILYRTTSLTSKHSRIIWGCSWSHDSLYFATVSRDKTLNIWNVTNEIEIRYIVKFTSDYGLNAVDFAPNNNDRSYLLAIGNEKGGIIILDVNPFKPNCSILCEFSKDFCHSDTITRLRFRPCNKKMGVNENKVLELASSSLDNTVKIFRLNGFFS